MAERTIRDLSRDSSTRAEETRATPWTDESPLPTPDPEPGWSFRWCRMGSLERPDDANMNRRMRDGWIPVKASDYPNLARLADRRRNSQDTIEIGGLILCKMPEDRVKARNEHFAHLSEQQVRSVNAALQQVQHPSMPMTIDMKSRVGGT